MPATRSPAITPEQFTTFGDLLKFLRRRAGLTQRELAIAVGYSTSQISRLEQNERPPDGASIAARFVPALHLEEEPAWLARLLELAAGSRTASQPPEPEAIAEAPAPPNNLPIQLTSFIGRENDIVRVKRLLASSRLVTLTGPGGAGKTRLSLQVAAQMLPDFPDGAWFAELAPLTDPALVPQAVASALGLRDKSGRSPMALLADHLRVKTALIVLDNCEHLIARCAQLADELLHAAPKITLLASSREALNIGGETDFRVPPLAAPDPQNGASLENLSQYDAVKLFVERAGAVRPTFGITPANAQAVAQICYHLDGIPLAIELAAARVRGLNVEQIAERLDDRFRLLTTGGWTALPRHQTLGAMIDWSHALLTSEERILFRRLAVFAGSWSIEAAETICAFEGDGSRGQEAAGIASSGVLDLLLRLVDKSLIGLDENSAETRYRMLETIHEYALGRLREAGEESVARARHLDFFRQLAERANSLIHEAEHQLWMNRLTADYENIRGALDWSLRGGDVDSGLLLAGALGNYWTYRSLYNEAQSWLERLVAAGQHASSRARALGLMGLASFESEGSTASAARLHIEESLMLVRKLDDPRLIAIALVNQSQVALFEARYADAIACLDEAQALHKSIGYRRGLFQVSLILGDVARAQGDYPKAGNYYEAALAFAHEMGNKTLVSLALGELAIVDLRQGENQSARTYLFESLTVARAADDREVIAYALMGLGTIRGRFGQPHEAARLYAASEALLETIGLNSYKPSFRPTYEPGLEEARAQLSANEFDRAWAEGRAMTLEQAIELALQA